MQFWLIEDGEKSGPFEDYELRERIRSGQVTGESKIWHEGAEGWLVAREVRVLQNEFEKLEHEETKPEVVVVEQPPFLFWRRFGARWFDVFIYGLIMMTIYRIGGLPVLPDLSEEPSIQMIFLKSLPFIFMEAAFICSIGYTPGKWLMSLKVTNGDGGVLSTGAAVMRSLRVWVLGMGMGQILLMVIAHLVALWMGKKKGAPLWDLPLGHRVTGPEPTQSRLVAFFALLFLIFVINFLIVGPELEEWTNEAIRLQEGK